MSDFVPADWSPTPGNVNALPDPLRRYIHDLETRCDPAGDVARLILIEDQNKALQAKLVELSATAPQIPFCPRCKDIRMHSTPSIENPPHGRLWWCSGCESFLHEGDPLTVEALTTRSDDWKRRGWIPATFTAAAPQVTEEEGDDDGCERTERARR